MEKRGSLSGTAVVTSVSLPVVQESKAIRHDEPIHVLIRAIGQELEQKGRVHDGLERAYLKTLKSGLIEEMKTRVAGEKADAVVARNVQHMCSSFSRIWESWARHSSGTHIIDSKERWDRSPASRSTLLYKVFAFFYVHLDTQDRDDWWHQSADQMILTMYHMCLQAALPTQTTNTAVTGDSSRDLFLHNTCTMLFLAPISLARRLLVTTRLYEHWALVPPALWSPRVNTPEHTRQSAVVAAEFCKSSEVDEPDIRSLKSLTTIVGLYLQKCTAAGERVDSCLSSLVEYLWMTYLYDERIEHVSNLSEFLDFLHQIKTSCIPAAFHNNSILCDEQWTIKGVQLLTLMHRQVYSPPVADAISMLACFVRYCYVSCCVTSALSVPSRATGSKRGNEHSSTQFDAMQVLPTLQWLLPLFTEALPFAHRSTGNQATAFQDDARACWVQLFHQSSATMPCLERTSYLVMTKDEHRQLQQDILWCGRAVHWHSIVSLRQLWRAIELFPKLLACNPNAAMLLQIGRVSDSSSNSSSNSSGNSSIDISSNGAVSSSRSSNTDMKSTVI